MNWDAPIRQAHRWLSLTFATIVAGIFVAMALGKQPANWVYFLPLLPLALLMLTGLWMFFVPHIRRPRHIQ